MSVLLVTRNAFIFCWDPFLPHILRLQAASYPLFSRHLWLVFLELSHYSLGHLNKNGFICILILCLHLFLPTILGFQSHFTLNHAVTLSLLLCSINLFPLSYHSLGYFLYDWLNFFFHSVCTDFYPGFLGFQWPLTLHFLVILVTFCAA